MRRLLRALLVPALAAAAAITPGLSPTTTPQQAAADTVAPLAAAPVNVYTTPGEHTVNGRKWRTTCEAYSSAVERCRTEIWATVTSWNGRAFTNRTDWAFNNLTYKPVPVATWADNPLATPGRHNLNGRMWKVDCGTEWTGAKACRAMIMATVPEHSGRSYRLATKWVFNNIIMFTDRAPEMVVPTGPETVITPTTREEVASTWRAGCPVGPSQLSTIRINQIDLDGDVHRGEIIVRRDLAPEVAKVFERAFAEKFPIALMLNPNHWGGNDIAMMAANNSSAFNCRHVVGNPSAQSPHSYGIAVDINPVQNPYRDPQGRWYPSTQHVKRTPVVPGMLTTNSAPVKGFQSYGWRWFSGWDWHHFEYRGPRRPTTQATATDAAEPMRAGTLSEASLGRPAGWEPVVADETHGLPLEDGASDVGAWGHAVDPQLKSTDLFALGCVEAPDVEAPIAAIEGLLDDDGHPGVTLALEFADDTRASAWFDAWRSASGACDDVTVISQDSDGWTAERSLYDGDWAEEATRDGAVVHITMLNRTAG